MTRLPAARLITFALLATLGSLQWVRYVEGASATRAIEWAAAGTITVALVTAAQRRVLPEIGAMLGGLALAVAASGLDLTYLEPKHLDELGDGLARGLAALNTVRLPYLGREPWVLTTVQLSGALLCWAAGAMSTGGSRLRVAALLVLLTMAAAPVVSIGAQRPILLGLALAVLVAAFLFGERLAARPGLGAIALAVTVLVAAVPLGGAADREEPWFDYKAFSEKLSGGTPVSYDWDHDYGPIDWPRDGVELFRVKSDRPYYWKADVLNRFANDRWTTGAAVSGELTTPRRRQWEAGFRVALRRLRTDTVVGAGTVLDVNDSTRPVEPDYTPGLWSVDDGKTFSKGDSYRVDAYVPRPSPDQLAAATVGRDPRHGPALRVEVGIRPEAVARTPSIDAPYQDEIHPTSATLQFAPYESSEPPSADYVQLGLTGDGGRALRLSTYARTWRLASRLRRASRSPYDYLLRVNDYLRSDGFVYTEVPDTPPPGVPPLQFFLLDSKAGYCQQFSGAMALLLRMGGIPARVATGFSPGGLRASSDEWVVRDTDAHSWVEAWFDGLGWVTFDPTPPDTPARSLVAAVDPAPGEGADGTSANEQADKALSQDGGKDAAAPDAAPAGGAGAGDDGPVWPWLGLGALFAAAIAAAGARLGGRRTDALAELERALRRSGRPVSAAVTLRELERSLGGSGYVAALRAARYRSGEAPGPTAADRARLRRELAAGRGWRGRLRSLYALPPRPR